MYPLKYLLFIWITVDLSGQLKAKIFSDSESSGELDFAPIRTHPFGKNLLKNKKEQYKFLPKYIFTFKRHDKIFT